MFNSNNESRVSVATDILDGYQDSNMITSTNSKVAVVKKAPIAVVDVD